MSWHVGDTTPPFTATLQSEVMPRAVLPRFEPVDLTGAEVAVHLRRPDGTALVLEATATALGEVAASWADPIDQAGTWTAEVQVTYPDGKVQTFGPQTFVVSRQIG